MGTVPSIRGPLGVLVLTLGLLAGCGTPAPREAPLTTPVPPVAGADAALSPPPAGPLATMAPPAIPTGPLPVPTGPAPMPTPVWTATPAGPYHTPTPWPTFPPRLAGGPDAAAWNAAATKLARLRTYHRSEVEQRGISAAHLEADIVLPHSVHLTAEGGSEYIEINGDEWEHAAGDPPGVFHRVLFIGPPFNFDPAAGAGPISDVTQTGAETIDGTATLRYTFTFQAVRQMDVVMQVAGHGEAWIARDSGYFRRIHWKVEETSEPAQTWERRLDFSRFNDPAIAVVPPRQ
jgi:hypothetical protein